MTVELVQEVRPDRVVLRGPELAECFFRASDDRLSHRGGWDMVFGDRFGHGVLNVDGPRHRELRAALMPALTRRAADGHRDLVAEVFGRALPHVPLDRPVDVRALLRPAVFEVSAALFAGVREAAAAELFTAYTELLDPGASLGDETGARVARQVVRARRRLREALSGAVAALAETDGPVSRLRALPDGPSDEEIAENMAIVVLAGFDTTSHVTARLLWLLARHPAQQEAVRADETGAALDRAFTETLRLFPPLAWLPRRAETDLELGELSVRAGSGVFYAVAEAHRDPAVFDAPGEFRPERYADGEPAGFALTPFGGGRRLCPGVHVGTMEAKLITSTVLARHRLSAGSPEHVEDVSHNGSTVTPAAPLLVRFEELP